ncbi:A-kinase anchor protein 14 [Cyclopterus lumpus]|uniref:A-kinase anchor protein 14 n=1 Tax=Cyclopterus lumpus TaxID=8103 RepID=UPI0014860B99|nr:A-kinase anchor protein 14 [Cyclopterus lumpus]
MEEDPRSSNRNSKTESAQLMKTLLERRAVGGQVDESADCKVATVNWVASKDFSVDMGLNQIGEYIQTWEMQHGWSHSLLFLSSTEEEQHTFHHYRARFSTTTSRRPIQETASVYFVAVVSKVNPQTLPVEVHFVVESNRLVHTAGSTRFREKWLADVIESKASLLREVDLWSTLDTEEPPGRRCLDREVDQTECL